jgi:hypothetical protein
MKKTATFVFAIALSSAGLHAQKPRTIEYGGGFRFEAAAQEEPATLTKIFSNLGPATSAYSNEAYGVTGPNSSYGSSAFVAMAFTPKANSHVSQVRAALQYNASGANQVNLSLYSDASGIPGVLLAGPVTVTNLPALGTCCTLAIANFHAVAVTAGTQYWVVADTPGTGTGSDFDGGWAFVPPSKNLIVGVDIKSGGWYSFPAVISEPAGAAYGTVP